jgi:hypothetical protein
VRGAELPSLPLRSAFGHWISVLAGGYSLAVCLALHKTLITSEFVFLSGLVYRAHWTTLWFWEVYTLAVSTSCLSCLFVSRGLVRMLLTGHICPVFLVAAQDVFVPS